MSAVDTIRVRRDTAAIWTSVNPILRYAEIGLETDTRKIKFGDGVTAWTGLAYSYTGSGTVTGVTGTAPIASSGGTAPAISITAASGAAAGSMSAVDKTKLDAITGTNTGDQTTITGNAGTATKLATARTLGITGDLVWTSPSFDGSGNVTAAGTLATVNATTGTFGSATKSLTVTANGKGLITSISEQTVTPAVGSITGLGTGVGTALGIAVGSAGAPITFNGALGTPSSGTLTNCTFPTLNQNTTGSAATLTTGRTLAITGDLVWTSPSFNGSGNVTAAGTLATVNSNVGSFGSATQTATFTVNAKGLTTAASNVTITPAVGSITGLGTGVATALAINIGSAGAFVALNGALGTPSSGTLTNCTFPTLNQNTTGSAATLTTSRNIDGQAFNGSANITVIAPGTHAATTKATPVDADELPLVDSAASNVLAKLTWANLKATLKTYFDTLYHPARNGCMVRKAADQIGLNATASSNLTFDSECYDDGGWHDNVTNNSRLTVPAGITRVRVGGSVSLANATTAGVNMLLTLLKGGTNNFDGSISQTSYSNSRCTFSSGPMVVTAGDYFELNLFFPGDTSIDIVSAQTNFWIEAC